MHVKWVYLREYRRPRGFEQYRITADMPKTYKVLKLQGANAKEEVLLLQEKQFLEQGSALNVYSNWLVIITGGFPDIELDVNQPEQLKLLDKEG